MPKRAERRHHEERIREKFRKVAKRWARSAGDWIQQRWVPRLEDGKLVGVNKLDASGAVRRMQYIEKMAAKLAHHNKCDCGMCKRDRYRKNRHHEKVLDKIYIEEGRRDGEQEE